MAGQREPVNFANPTPREYVNIINSTAYAFRDRKLATFPLKIRRPKLFDSAEARATTCRNAPKYIRTEICDFC
jgi:hypothetical protein